MTTAQYGTLNINTVVASKGNFETYTNSTPANGDLWYSSGFQFRNEGSTVALSSVSTHVADSTIHFTNPLTTKGDLWIYGTSSMRLPIGTDGQVLTADSAEANGVKWSGSGGGGSLATLTDATITSPADGQFLIYETASSKWKNTNLDSRIKITDDATPSKVLQFQLSGLDAATTYTMAIDNSQTSFTVANLAGAQTLTNKILTGTTNTIHASHLLNSSGAGVSVNTSTPIAGQVLTATSGTVATWQTSGSFNANTSTVKIGLSAGSSHTGSKVICIGDNAGTTGNGGDNICIGSNSGGSTSADTISIGRYAGGNSGGNRTGAIAIGVGASNDSSLGEQTVSIGYFAGQSGQSYGAVAIGYTAATVGQARDSFACLEAAGYSNQGQDCIAIGKNSGRVAQGAGAIALGYNAGYQTQGTYSIAIGYTAGYSAGPTAQHARSIVLNATGAVLNSGATDSCKIAPIRSDAGTHYLKYNTTTKEVTYDPAAAFNANTSTVKIGTNAGSSNTGTNVICIGNGAAPSGSNGDNIHIGSNMTGSASSDTISMGRSAGGDNSGSRSGAVAIGTASSNNSPNALRSIAIGHLTAQNNQGSYAIAFGPQAGQNTQGSYAFAAVENAGLTSQGQSAIALGRSAGRNAQGADAIAIGRTAGDDTQGTFSIAIGFAAGLTAQHARSIVLNATGVALNTGATDTCKIAPVRSDAGEYSLKYNTTTKEVTYDTAKTFVIQHPTKEDNYLVHACLEGPENGVYYRGKSEITNGESCIVTLPNYCSAWEDFTINLTPIRNKCVLACSEVIDNKYFHVYCDNNCKFYWTVYASRTEQINTEPHKSEYTKCGDGPYSYLVKSS